MRKNLGPTVDLNFLDGYLFHLMQQIANDRGMNASGFAGYYDARIKQRIGALAEYDGDIARYLLERGTKRVVHAGMGIGALACALACNGVSVVGVEASDARIASARRIRDAAVEIWPDIRYDIVHGLFPEALAGQSFVDSTLLFTNVGAGWDDAMLDRVISSMANFGEVFLDLRLFGSKRDEEADRAALFERIAKSARGAERLLHVSSGVYLARFAFA
jgi:hypothetical protein